MVMKKSLLFLLLAFPMMAFAGMMATPKNICGRVRFTDGHEETFGYVQLPKCATAKLTVGQTGGKNLRDIPSQDVSSLTVWHVDHPDKTATLYVVDFCSIWAKHKDKVSYRWCTYLMHSDWGVVYRISSEYAIENSTGDFYTITVKQNGVGDDSMILKCRDFEHGQFVGIVWGRDDPEHGLYTKMAWQVKPKRIATLFASNARIYQQVYDAQLTAKDLQYILDQMALTTEEERTAVLTPKPEPTKGIDNQYYFMNRFSLDYTNYFSANQSLYLAWEFNMNYFFMGLHAGLLVDKYQSVTRIADYEHYQYIYLRDTITRPSLGVGVRMGVEVPIRVQKYRVIPRFMVAPTAAPLTFRDIDGHGVYVDIPFSLGCNFNIPLKGKRDRYFQLGLHYVYDISLNDGILTNVDSRNHRILNGPIEYVDQTPVIGQSGLMFNVSFVL